MRRIEVGHIGILTVAAMFITYVQALEVLTEEKEKMRMRNNVICHGFICQWFEWKKYVQESKIKYCIARENDMLLRATNPISVFVLFIAY